MSRQLPPLDLHAHIDPGIDTLSLESLGAVVFAATRSAQEFERTLNRHDAVTAWGLGYHPGVAAALTGYDEKHFARLLLETPLVSEVGLDGRTRIPIDRQAEVFASILSEVRRTPRLVSVHSNRATRLTLELIEKAGVAGVILHWWLGTRAETRRAVDLGCTFSINRSMDAGQLRTAGVPLSSILPETDHPSGNRTGHGLRQPGWTLDVEQMVATVYGTTPEDVRMQFWHNLVQQVDTVGVATLLPPVVQAMMAHARGN